MTEASETAAQFEAEVEAGKRFRFGSNWASFLRVLNEERIGVAEESIRDFLGDMSGLTMLDAGSGSGLFSLAARRLGAVVSSFDFDPDSVACTAELKRRYFADDPDWSLLGQNSVLDDAFMDGLGQFDVVYSWGVLHHTGDMWRAIDNAASRVKPGGRLFIMIYMDRGAWSHTWKVIKRTYVSGPVGKAAVLGATIPYYVGRGMAEDLVRLKDPRARYREYKKKRGMSKYHDWIDWVGGYPYEYASPAALCAHLEPKGFEMVRNDYQQYVFQLKE